MRFACRFMMLVVLGIFLAVLVRISVAGSAEPPVRPDPVLTPGVIRTTDLGEICQRGRATQVRAVSS